MKIFIIVDLDDYYAKSDILGKNWLDILKVRINEGLGSRGKVLHISEINEELTDRIIGG